MTDFNDTLRRFGETTRIGLAPKSLLLWALLVGRLLQAADSPLQTSDVATFSCGGVRLTSVEILAGRYPDPELLDIPEPCKAKARQLVQKWRQEDANNLETLAAEACAETSISVEHWVLEKGLKKLERETEVFDLGCACSSELLARSTNPPAPPSVVTLVTELGPVAPAGKGATNNIPVRYSPQVKARRAIAGMTRNAAELVKILSGTTGTHSNLFDVTLIGQWNNDYKSALQAALAEAGRIEQLSIALDPPGSGPGGTPSQANTIPAGRSRLLEQTRLLVKAYEGIAQDRELPRGQCYEVFAIRHEMLLRLMLQLASPAMTK